MKDPYELLGVARAASADDIRKAYRRLAKKFHPDLNPGNKEFEDRFKDLSIANDILSDPVKRKRFDSGEIDAVGVERPPQQYYKDYAAKAPPGNPYANQSAYADFADADELFAEIFRRQAQQARNARGQDLHYILNVDFLDAVNGGMKRLTLPDGGVLDVGIPAGIQQGQTLRLRGKGAPSAGEGESGDALVQVSIMPHKFFTRVGNDIHLELPVSFSEAVLGGRVKVPTADGSVLLTVPKGSNTGTVLRLKGKGVPYRAGRGDELIKLKIMAPTVSDPKLEAFLSTWSPSGYDPRKEFQS